MGYQVNRTEDAREQQLADVARMYLTGQTQAAIGRHLNLTQQQISYDMKIVRSRWLESSIRNFDEARSIELAKVDRIEAEYWSAWERSKNTRLVTMSKKREGDKASTEAGVRKEDQVGDPRFLDGVMKCVSKRCDILGLNAPLKQAWTDPTGMKDYGPFLTDDERASRLAQFLNAGTEDAAGQTVM